MHPLMKWASTRQNLSFGFLTKRVSNQPGQLERLAKKIGIFARSKSRCDTLQYANNKCADHGSACWLRGYKTFFMLNSAEHEIYPAHKC